MDQNILYTISRAYLSGKSCRQVRLPITENPYKGTKPEDVARSEAFKLGWNHEDQYWTLVSVVDKELENIKVREEQNNILGAVRNFLSDEKN